MISSKDNIEKFITSGHYELMEFINSGPDLSYLLTESPDCFVSKEMRDLYNMNEIDLEML